METGNIKEKRIKREIANSNERRRMQSINAGFQKLKRLLPVNDGEKISKANILQHAADFITTIERDRIALYEQNTHIKRCLIDIKAGKLDVGMALDAIETAIANKALPTIPLNPLVTASSSASSTPTSTPTPSPSLESQSEITASTIATSAPNSRQTKSTTIKTTTNNINNNNHSTARTTRKYTRRQPIKSRNTNTTSTAGSTKRNAGKRKHNDIIISNSMNIMNNNANSNNNNNIISMSNSVNVGDNIQNIGSVAEIISDKITSPKNGPTVPGGGIAKAAIALPLEVPYTSEIVTKSHHHHSHLNNHHNRVLDSPEPMIASRNMLKSETVIAVASAGAAANVTTSPTVDSHEPASKGQTLDTICKAIMEIEGDRVFNSERNDQHATTRIE